MNLSDLISSLPLECDTNKYVFSEDEKHVYFMRRPKDRDQPPSRNLADIIGVYTQGPQGRRKDEDGHTEEKYTEFLDFIL